MDTRSVSPAASGVLITDLRLYHGSAFLETPERLFYVNLVH